jgi:hypothetical protein
MSRRSHDNISGAGEQRLNVASLNLTSEMRKGAQDGVEVAIKRMSDSGVRRDKAALSSGCKSHPATAPAGSNRSSYGGNEVAEAFG